MEAQHRLQQVERWEKASPHVIGRWAGNILHPRCSIRQPHSQQISGLTLRQLTREYTPTRGFA